MDMLKRLFLWIVFLACLGGGFVLALNLGERGQAQGLPVVESPIRPGEHGVAPNGQRNLLLIGVDSLESENPQLKSVWLVMQIATHSPQRFTLLPLYPASEAQVLIPQAQIAASFGLDASGAISPDFFEAIRAADFWWSNYLALDESGLAEVIDLGGGVDLGQGALNGEQVAQLLNSPQSPTAEGLSAQGRVFQAVCSQSAEKLLSADARQTFQKLGRRLRTDLEIERFIHEWQMPLVLAGRPSCEFPTLQASQIASGGQ